MKIARRLALGILGAAALPLAAQPPGTLGPPPQVRVIGAKLEATPREYKGPCPVTIKFHGSIETNGPGPVKYTFKRSDGATDTIVKTLTFGTAPFHLAIAEETWTLGGPGMVFDGWEAIHIESPNAGFLSNRAPFHIRCDGAPGGGNPPGDRKPDLVVTQFGMKAWGKCAAHSAVYTFQVTVKNQGNAPSPSSAALGNKALVQAMAQDKPGWGNGALLNALAPGASQTVDIPVYYLMSDPAFMVNNAPHPFMAIADPLGLVNESDEGNNEKGPINMGAPQGCAPTRPAVPAQKK
jgi:hypothetical protein